MPDAFTTGMAVYAACEADDASREAAEAREVARRAEAQAFVKGYCHDSASPAERQRYIESVGVLYPQPVQDRDMTPMEKRVVGGVIVGVFVWLTIAGVIGKVRHDSVGDGVLMGLVTLSLGTIGGCFAALLVFGFALLMGFA